MSLLPGRWDEQVVDRIVAEARGIPLARVELPKESTPTEYAGGFGLPRAAPVNDRVRAAHVGRIAGLPPETRRLLLTAAAEPTGDPVLLWRAAERLGLSAAAASSAVALGLIVISDRVAFSHPTVRSTVYWDATHDERCAVHRALSDATDPLTDPDRRAWHAARGAQGPDEGIAEDLERSAARARVRGGLAAAAAFMSRSAELTPDPVRRRERALHAARAARAAGSPDDALRLLSMVEAGPVDERRQGELDLLRAQIAFATKRGRDTASLFLRAARQLEPHDVELARDTYLEAISAAMFAGPQDAGGQAEMSRAALDAPPAPHPPRPVDLLLDGTATRIALGHAAGVDILRTALAAFRDPGLPEPDGLRWLWMAGATAVGLWDQEGWDELSGTYLKLTGRTGQTAALPLALTMRTVMHTCVGELDLASALVEKAQLVSEAVGTPPPLYGALLLAAWQGHEAEVARLSRTAEAEALRRGEGNGPVMGNLARAVVADSTGRYQDALATAREAGRGSRPLEVGGATWALSEFIEAAARAGAPDEAADALRRLTEVTGPSGTNWALGVEARALALVGGTDEAEDRYREAIDRLSRTRLRGDLARTHLLYNEWFRRERRRQTARTQLRTAYDLFTTMGMTAFAARSARELQAAGMTVTMPRPSPRANSWHRRARSSDWSATASPTPRSGPGCSSAPALSNGTFRRS
ncbi:LuxR family transcriptional regulator [Kitasatospora sp. NPDC058444]|uniref:LuxR family transcriptional regulator n=1 Tax=Kitasatospora sp. NPDC058444 TaxID=3346504 RepID=UPI00364E459A